MKNKKLKIGVCDNQREVHDVVKSLVREYQGEQREFCETVHFLSGEEVLGYTEELDALLLNVEMSEMDGFETAKKLNLQGIDYKIIMVGGTSERFKEAFKVGAFRFVTEPIEKEELFDAIDHVKQEIVEMEKVAVSQNGIIYQIVQRDICYIEANKPGTNIYTRDKKYRSSLSMEEWLEQLNDKLFYRCHKSYIVNISRVKEIGDDVAWLMSGEKVSVARRRKKEMHSRFFQMKR